MRDRTLAIGPTVGVLFFVISLLISSTLISLSINDKLNEKISKIELSSGVETSKNFNFTDCSKNYTEYFTPDYQKWTCTEGIGITSPSNELTSFYFIKALPYNNTYTAMYYINASEPFRIYPRIRVSTSLTGWYNADGIVGLHFEKDSIRIPSNFLDSLNDLKITYPNLLPNNNLNITTILKDSTNNLTLYIDNSLIINEYPVQPIPSDALTVQELRYYGGISTWQGILAGFNHNITLMKLNASLQSQDPNNNIFQTTNNILTTLLTVIAWNVDSSYFPDLLNLILIKTQIFAIIILGFFAFLHGG
jgi:hypothetical protein